MDFDPRWNDDPRNDDHRDDLRREESGRELNQGSRGISSDPLERNARDPRDVFTRDLDLPRGPDRERVWFREHSVLLRGSESRALATTGAFRVVHADDLRDSRSQAYNPRSGELRHLREQKLVRTIPIRDGRALVVLTERGRDVLERNRHEREQHFYSGLQRPPRVASRREGLPGVRTRGRAAARGWCGRPSRDARHRAETRVSAVPSRAQPRQVRQRRPSRSFTR